MFFPPGFVIPELFGRFAAAAAEHLPHVRARIAGGDWPSWLADTASGEGSVTCWVCHRGFKNAWCHRGVCYACEADTRANDRCPFGKGLCPAKTWYVPVAEHTSALMRGASFTPFILFLQVPA
jgi:hypothetical protein